MEEIKSTSPTKRPDRRQSFSFFEALRQRRLPQGGSRHVAISKCLNRVQSGGNDPWNSYLGHRGLTVFDMELISNPLRPEFRSKSRLANADLGDWLRDPSNQSEDTKASLKLLIVAAE